MRWFRRTTTALVALVSASCAVVPASGVSVSQTYPIPPSGAFTLIGHGFGHSAYSFETYVWVERASGDMLFE